MATNPAITDTDRVVDYTPAGSTASFVVPWPVYYTDGEDPKNDLGVIVNGAELDTTDFEFVGTVIAGLTGAYNGGTLTLDTAVSSQQVIIWSRRDPRRVGYYLEGKTLPMTELDKLQNDFAVQMRDLDFKFKSAIHGTAQDALSGSLLLPVPAGRSNKFPYFDASGILTMADGVPATSLLGPGTLQIFTSNSAYATLAAADAVAQALGAELVIDKNWTLLANTVLTAKVVRFAGGIITRGAHTLSGNFWAPPTTQMFDAAGTGAVTIPNEAEVSICWFGADPAASDNFNAITQAIATGNYIYAPGLGTYKVSAPLDFSGAAGSRGMRGDGNLKTVFAPTTGNVTGVIWLAKTGVAQWAHYADFGIAGNATCPWGLKLGSNSTTGYAGNNVFDRLRITGFTGAGAAGIVFWCALDSDFNCCVIKQNTVNIYRPDTNVVDGFVTTVRFQGMGTNLDLATGVASILADGSFATLVVDGATIRSCAGRAIVFNAPVNYYAAGSALHLSQVFFENNNTANIGAAAHEIQLTGKVGAQNELVVHIDNATAFHAAANTMKTLSLDNVIALIEGTSGLDFAKVTTTANTQAAFLNNHLMSQDSADIKGLSGALLGQIFFLDKGYFDAYWFLGGNVPLYPLKGIRGTDTNDSATAGNVGENIQSAVSGISAAGDGVYFDLTSIPLTPGDWDVVGQFVFVHNGATYTGGGTGIIGLIAGNSGASDVPGDTAMTNPPPTATANPSVSVTTRISIAVNTTVYLKAVCHYSAGTAKASGKIKARRVR